MEIKNKIFLVYGMGKAGQSAANYLKANNAKKVYCYDDINSSTLKGYIYLQNIEQAKNHKVDFCILSPGVQIIGNKNIEFLKANNIAFESDFSFSHRLLPCKSICVTGTNGKTTTVNLIYKLLCKKHSCIVCGNTNMPLFDALPSLTKDSIAICEVSSFALETSSNFRPYISVITNVTSDHLERHKTLENYKSCKNQITNNQNKNCYFVCSADYKIKTKAKKLNFSLCDGFCDCYIKNNYIYYKTKKIINIKKLKLKGQKNIENVLCAILCAKIFNIKNSKIIAALKKFTPPPHRLEFAKKAKGVVYINDSKATNLASTQNALSYYNKNVILLLGGQEKGCDFKNFFLHTECKYIIFFGNCGRKLYDLAKCCGLYNIGLVKTCKDAIVFAQSFATKGDVVLFSPACASFDEFVSYKQRGEFFRQIVTKNKNKKI